MERYKPLISAIIAVYNGGLHLEEAIKSVISQQYDKYELIIIDGGSTDESLHIINKYNKFTSYAISEPDKGIYDAWNKGVKVANGDWIVFIGSDDILYPYSFNSYVEYINSRLADNLEFVSSKIEIIDIDKNTINLVGAEWKWPLFKKKMITWHVGTFHSIKLFNKYGLFDETYKISGDYEFLLRARDQLKAGFLPIATVMMRDGGISATLLYKAIDETYRAKVKNKIVLPWISPLLIYKSKLKLFLKINLVNLKLSKKYN